MSAAGLDVFDKTVQTTNIWLDEIMEFGPDRHIAWHVLARPISIGEFDEVAGTAEDPPEPAALSGIRRRNRRVGPFVRPAWHIAPSHR